jgi:hypothetical protein
MQKSNTISFSIPEAIEDKLTFIYIKQLNKKHKTGRISRSMIVCKAIEDLYMKEFSSDAKKI